eukprot:PhF_6_TR27881/c0_g1_i1/m.40811
MSGLQVLFLYVVGVVWLHPTPVNASPPPSSSNQNFCETDTPEKLMLALNLCPFPLWSGWSNTVNRSAPQPGGSVVRVMGPFVFTCVLAQGNNDTIDNLILTVPLTGNASFIGCPFRNLTLSTLLVTVPATIPFLILHLVSINIGLITLPTKSSSLEIEQSTFSHVSLTSSVSGSVTIQNVFWAQEYHSKYGCLQIENSGSVLLSQFHISGCFSKKVNGGGVGIQNTNTVVFQNVTCVRSSTDLNGGCVALASVALVIWNQVTMDVCLARRGGCLYASHLSLTFVCISCQFNGGTTTSSGSLVHIESGKDVHFTNSSFTDSESSTTEGSCLFFNFTTSLFTDSVIQNCVGANGVHAMSSTLTFQSVSLSHMVTSQQSALYLEKSSAYISQSYFIDCLQFDSDGMKGGGCIYSVGSDEVENMILLNQTVITNCSSFCVSLDGNTYGMTDVFISNASRGGLVISNGYGTLRSLHFKFCESASMGSCLSMDSTKVFISDSTFTSCTAVNSGGALYATSVTSLLQIFPDDNPFLRNVTFQNCVGKEGGCLYLSDSHYFVQSVNFVSCYAHRDGGSIFLDNVGLLQVSDSYFFNSSSGLSGGGIHALIKTGDMSINLGNVTFDSCTAGSNGGAILLNSNAGRLNIDDSQFLNCRAREDGGAIYQMSVESILKVVSFSNCTAGSNGGAMCVSAPNIVLLSVTAERNYAGLRGGFAHATTRSITLTTTELQNNHALYGGALFAIANEEDASYATVALSQSTLMANSADVGGAAACVNICVVGDSVTDSYFVNNTARMLGGAIFYKQEDSCSLDEELHFVGNTASHRGENISAGMSFTIHASPVFFAGILFRHTFCFDMFDPLTNATYSTSLLDNFRVHMESSTATLLNASGALEAIHPTSPLLTWSDSEVTTCTTITFAQQDDSTDELSLKLSLVPKNPTFDFVYSTNVTRTITCPTMYYMLSGQCIPCPQGTFRIAGTQKFCEVCPKSVVCNAGVSSYNISRDGAEFNTESILLSYVKSNNGFWWDAEVGNNTQKLDDITCAPGMCLGNNQCLEGHSWNSRGCALCQDGSIPWGRVCGSCTNEWEMSRVVLRVVFAFLYLGVLHRASGGDGGDVKIFFAHMEVMALLFVVKSMRGEGGDGSVLFGSLSSLVQGTWELTCFGPLTIEGQQYLSLMHMAAILLMVPLVHILYHRFFPLHPAHWRHTLCSLVFLFTQMSTRQMLQAISCVGDVNVFQPAMKCESMEARRVFIIYAVISSLCLTISVGLIAFLQYTTYAKQQLWPVFFVLFDTKRYVSKWWAWVVLSRRVAFVCAFVFGSQFGPQWALGAIGVTAIVYATVHYFVRPYRRPQDDAAEYLSLMSISLLCHVMPLVGEGWMFYVTVFIACAVPGSHVLISKGRLLHAIALSRFFNNHTFTTSPNHPTTSLTFLENDSNSIQSEELETK